VDKRTLQFRERYDALAEKYTDPVEVLFNMLADEDVGVRLKAASTLVSYRYPKLRAVETTQNTNLTLGVNLAGLIPLQANPEPLDVTPTPPALEVKSGE